MAAWLTNYRGSTPAKPRYGHIRTTHQCGSIEHAALAAKYGQQAVCQRYCRARLDLTPDGENAYAGIYRWRGEQDWAEREVRTAYRRRWKTVRHILIRRRGGTTGGGVSLKALVAIAAAMATHADHNTGHNCRVTNARISELTGYSISHISRTRLALLLLGVATEVLRGRPRRKNERLATHHADPTDKARGWASVWALHPATYEHPVDNSRPIRAGLSKMATHPRRVRLGLLSPVNPLVTTGKRLEKRAASPHSPDKKRAYRAGISRKAAVLASRWLREPQTPAWARTVPAEKWVPVWRDLAEHGWTPADLNTLIADYQRGWAAKLVPDKPAAWLRWLLARTDLSIPPHVFAQAAAEMAAAEEIRAEADRVRTEETERAARTAAQAAGKALRGSNAHLAAMRAAADAAARARAKRCAEDHRRRRLS